MGGLRERLGILKSRFIYDFRPVKRRKMKQFYASLLPENGTTESRTAAPLAFDIGAHTGNRSAVWLDLGARVVAVEPQLAFADLLRRRFKNRGGDVTVLRAALGPSGGEAELNVSSNNPTVSSLSGEWAELMSSIDGRIRWDKRETVPVLTLDSLIGTYGEPVFCKIDVEGYEAEVLEGLHRPLPALSFEFFPDTPEQTLRCIGRLEELAGSGVYRFNWVLGETFRYQSGKWLSGSTMKEIISGYSGRRSGDIYARLCS